jgi:peptide-methionine (S)-S-oxide reductase
VSESSKEASVEKATFAAGCFWGVEAAFRQVPGVTATRVGFTGGSVPDPSYRQVCTSETGHAEAVEVTFDPTRVSYEDLLAVFWAEHDPTTKDRQGWDIGPQYRSAIFFHSPEQEASARASKDDVQSRITGRTVVTEIEPAPEFYEAEDYHQRYFEKMGRTTCTTELREAAASGAAGLEPARRP